MKAKALLLIGLLATGQVKAQEVVCPNGIPAANNPGCIPPDQPGSPYYQGNNDSPDQVYPSYGYAPSSAPIQSPTAVDMWGAIAISPQIPGVSGSSLLMKSREAAEQQALDYCFPSVRETCRIAYTYVNGCVAVIKGDKDYDFQVAKTEDEAKRAALKECAARQDTNCTVAYSVCSLPKVVIQ